MYFVYIIIVLLSFLILSPYFAYQAWRNKKYISSFKYRLGGALAIEPTPWPTVWLHCVSVGETLAVSSLITILHERLPNVRIVLSTTTLTGQALARNKFSSWAQVIYFPFDLPWSVNRTLNTITPSLILIVETEIWPNFLRACYQRGIPTILINGRISAKSYQGYRRVRPFIMDVMNHFQRLLMQTNKDAERAIALGALPERVSVVGNLKYDIESPSQNSQILEILRQLDVGASWWIVAGSTARGEEEIIIEAFTLFTQQTGTQDACLLVAPRHPERFDEVATIIRKTGLNFLRRSKIISDPVDRRNPIVLLDTIGELATAYSLAGLVFVGGSLVNVGGHNILEPALFGKPIIVGPYTQNFQAIIEEFKEAQALIQLEKPAAGQSYQHQLSEIFSDLYRNKEKAEIFGTKARNLLEQNRGATERTYSLITKFIPVYNAEKMET